MSEQLILLVEDNEVNRDMLVRRLERAGHRVSTAGDGDAALQNMRALQPAVVLMDMNLPVKDGWSACERSAGCLYQAHSHHRPDRTRDGGRQTPCTGSRVLRLCHQTG